MVDTPEALIFDVFGTLVDWRTGIARHAAPILASAGIALDPLQFAQAWRARYQPAMEEIRNGNRDYVRLEQLHLENLEFILREFGIADTLKPQHSTALNKGWERLPPWPDTVAGLDRLHPRFFLAPCSNGSVAMMVRLARFGQLRWDAILGADIARAYKPDPGVYIAAAEALGLPPQRLCMVAAHNDDLSAARACGLQTAFIPRPTEYGSGQTTDLRPAEKWDYVADDLLQLADCLAI